MIDRWIAEATECDFKVALEIKKPKSWLKSVSAFANGVQVYGKTSILSVYSLLYQFHLPLQFQQHLPHYPVPALHP